MNTTVNPIPCTLAYTCECMEQKYIFVKNMNIIVSSGNFNILMSMMIPESLVRIACLDSDMYMGGPDFSSTEIFGPPQKCLDPTLKLQ